MVITEEELRQAWQNGRGQIPSFPPGTRFTPAALDFLKVREPGVLQACNPAPAAPAEAGQRRLLKARPGQREIFTAADVAGLLAAGGTLVIHPSVTVTHAALELLRKAGVRIIPYVESSPEAAAPAAAKAGPDPDEELFRRVREAVLARLGRTVDPAVLDAVLKRVLSAL